MEYEKTSCTTPSYTKSHPNSYYTIIPELRWQEHTYDLPWLPLDALLPLLWSERTQIRQNWPILLHHLLRRAFSAPFPSPFHHSPRMRTAHESMSTSTCTPPLDEGEGGCSIMRAKTSHQNMANVITRMLSQEEVRVVIGIWCCRRPLPILIPFPSTVVVLCRVDVLAYSVLA